MVESTKDRFIASVTLPVPVSVNHYKYRSGPGMGHRTTRAVAWHNKAAAAWLEDMRSRRVFAPVTGGVHLRVVILRPPDVSGDIDNFHKQIQDSMSKVVVVDDSQIWRTSTEIHDAPKVKAYPRGCVACSVYSLDCAPRDTARQLMSEILEQSKADPRGWLWENKAQELSDLIEAYF